MNHSRRSFIKRSGIAYLGVGAIPYVNPTAKHESQSLLPDAKGREPKILAQDEKFWSLIQKSFTRNQEYVNLENGYYSCLPIQTLNAQKAHIQRLNEERSHYMRTEQVEDRERVKKELADFAGCSVDELIVTRNTTESLNTIVFGLDFNPGDEAILCDQDYGSMQEQFKQQAQRKGLKLKWVEVPLHPQSDEEIVSIYEKEITPKTRILLVSHIINITGHVLPVRKIADMAHSHGVEVLCDGAHSFGHLEFQIPDLHVDYFGTSLHKWLCCPLGTGMLYIKREKIPQIWPLFGDVYKKTEDIRKLEHIGTQPCSTHLSILNALDFHLTIGSKLKEERLRYLRNYWMDQVRELPHIVLNSPKEDARSCGIGNVGVKGMTPKELSTQLFEKFKVYSASINRGAIQGVRVTPHLYTTLEDLDVLVHALKMLG